MIDGASGNVGWGRCVGHIEQSGGSLSIFSPEARLPAALLLPASPLLFRTGQHNIFPNL